MGIAEYGQGQGNFYGGQHTDFADGSKVYNLEILDVGDEYDEGELGGVMAIAVRATDRMDWLVPALVGRISSDLESVGFVVTRVKER